MVTAVSNTAQAQAAAAAMQAQKDQNRMFMALSVNKESLCQQSNGGANSQNFAAGQALTYTITSADNAYLTGIWIRCNLTNTLAAGTSAVYALNAAAPLTLIDSISVNYGGSQHFYRPYILKYLSQFKGANAQIQPRSVVAGQTDAYLQAYYASTFPVAVGANTWNFALYMPFNLIHPQDVRGILPIQAGETTCQVTINCAGSPYGPDPVLNTVVTTSGSGGASTVTGTVTVISTYKDGQSYSQLQALQPNLHGIDTVQIWKDQTVNNILAGQIFRGKVGYLARIPWMFLTVVDGQQSNKFAATSNVQYIETSADASGNRKFWSYGLNTNLDMREFYTDLSGKMGGLLQQDIDEGFFPLVYGPIFEQSDAGLLEGAAYLDTRVGQGWSDFHYGVQLASVGAVAGIAPRFETSLVTIADPIIN